MFHADMREPLKGENMDEELSTEEGRSMQPMDEQPSRPTSDESASDERSARNEQRTEDFQEPALEGMQNRPALQGGQKIEKERPAEEQAGGQGQTYRGVSEQVPLSYPPGSAPYQFEQSAPAQSETPPASGAPIWSYPPRPEQYQSGVRPPALGAPITRPFEQPPGIYQQPGFSAVGQPYGQAYNAPTGPIAGPGQPGMAGNPPAPPRRSGVRTGTLMALVALLAVVFGTGLFAGWQFGHTSANSSSPSSVLQPGNNSTVTVPQLTNNNVDAVREAVINKVQPAVVQINVTSSSQQALGSGVIIDKRGYIVTNNHVVSGASSIQVTLSNNTTFPARVVGTDAADDLAVIKITPPASGLTTVAQGDSSQLRVGQAVLAIGSPLGNENTVTSGIVSALNRNVSEGQNGPTLPDAIQTDAPINPGNSGGALVDMQGNLIGMPTLNAIDTEFNTPANGLGFAIPVNRIRFIAEQIVANGFVAHTGRAILGVTVTNVNPTVAAQYHLSVNSGALVSDVSSSSPAASAGMRPGDVITQVGDTTIHSISDLSTTMLRHKPGDTVSVKVYRGSQQLTLNVTLGELPAS